GREQMAGRERRVVSGTIEHTLDGLERPRIDSDDAELAEAGQDAVGEGVRDRDGGPFSLQTSIEFEAPRSLVARGSGLSRSVRDGDVVPLELIHGGGGANAAVLTRESQTALHLLRLLGLFGPEGQGRRRRKAPGETGEGASRRCEFKTGSQKWRHPGP